MPYADLTIRDFLRQLGDRTPTPGGGAAAGLAGSVAAATARMAANFSLKTGTPEAQRHEIECIVSRLSALTDEFMALAGRDALAYGRLNALQRLPEDDPKRVAEWSEAVAEATAAPEAMLALADELASACAALLPVCNRWLLSDLGIAAALARAAAEAAAWNIRVNLPLLDPAEAEHRREAMVTRLVAVQTLTREVEDGCRRE